MLGEVLTIVLGVMVASCGRGRSNDGEFVLRVATASSVRAAAEEVGGLFAAGNPGVRVEIIAGSTGSLGVKIREGAPFDVFLSADEETPRKLSSAGVIVPASLTHYADGRLCLWTRAGSDLCEIAEPLDALRDPRVRRVALANPRLAPYGKAAESFLEAVGLLDTISPRFAIAENAEQAAQFALTGSAELAFVSESLAMHLGEQGRWWRLSRESIPRLRHVGGVVTRSDQREYAAAFVAFLTGEEGQAVLSRHGLGKE